MVNLKDLKSHVINNPTIDVEINGATVKVKTYVPIEEKYGLIEMAVKNSVDYYKRIVDKLKLEVLFSYLVVKVYTDIELNMDNVNEEYDMLESNGIIDAIFKHIPKAELDFLVEHVESAVVQEEKYLNSLFGILDAVLDKLNFDIDKINNLVSQLNIDELKNVKEFYDTVSGQN